MILRWDKKRYFIFDFDGTIADTSLLHAEAFNEVFRTLGISNFQYDVYKGRKTVEVFNDFFKMNGLIFSDEELANFVRKKQETARRLMKYELKAFDGAIEFIKLLKQKEYILAIATSSSKKGVTLALDRLGIYHTFDYILTGDDVVNAKPSPDIYLKSLNAASILPQESVVVEDSASGAIAAGNAHIDVIIVNNNSLEKSYCCTDFNSLISELG